MGRVLGSADLGQHGFDPRVLPSLGALGPDLPACSPSGEGFALGLWNHQIADPKTGAFDRHAPYDRHGPVDGKDFPRHAAFYIHTWAHAYKYTQEDVFLTAIETELARYERKRRAETGAELATLPPLDLETAASLVPEPLCSRLHAFADREDQLILADLHRQYGRPDGSLAFQPTWQAGYSSGAAAGWAMFGWRVGSRSGSQSSATWCSPSRMRTSMPCPTKTWTCGP